MPKSKNIAKLGQSSKSGKKAGKTATVSKSTNDLHIHIHMYGAVAPDSWRLGAVNECKGTP